VSFDVDARTFIGASLVDRAVLLLKRAFREPVEPVSRLNVASAIANQADLGTGGLVAGGVLGGGRSADPGVMRLVSEAWQILESARLVCRYLTDPGDWWVLTAAGRAVRASADPGAEIRARLAGEP